MSSVQQAVPIIYKSATQIGLRSTAVTSLIGNTGGLTLIGGTASGDDLTLQSTSNATKGTIIFGTSGYDEVNNRLGIGTAVPAVPLEVVGNVYVSSVAGSPAITFSSANDVAVAADMLIGGNGIIAAETSLYLAIDSNNDSTNANFFWGINSPTSSMTELMRLSEAGQLGLNSSTYLGSANVFLAIEHDANNFIGVAAYGGGAVEPGIILYGANGTKAAPTRTLTGDALGGLYFEGFDTARSAGAAIRGVAAADWGDAGDTTDSPANILFQTVPDGTSTLTNRMFIGSDGKIGVGTIIPDYFFDIRSAGNSSSFHLCTTTTDTGLYLTTTSATQAIISGGVGWTGAAWEAKSTTGSIISQSGGVTVFSNDTGLTAGVTYTPTETMRLTVSNEVIIGNSGTSVTGIYGAPTFLVSRTTNGTMMLHRASVDNGGATLEFAKQRSGMGVVTDGDNAGSIGWSVADGTNLERIAQISALVDGVPGANDVPGRLAFYTTPDGSASIAERMRISENGYVSINNTAPVLNLHVGNGTDTTFQSYAGITANVAGVAQVSVLNSTANIEGGMFAYSSASVYMGAWTNHALVLRTNNADRITVEAGGQVGIANTSPQATLHVGAGADASGVGTATILASNAGTTWLSVRNSTADIEGILYVDTTQVIMGAYTNHDLHIRANNANVINIDATGTVGIGIAQETPLLVMEAGTSANSAAVGGILFVSTSQVGNVGTGQDVLNSYSVPANTLSTNGMSIWFEAHGTLAANLNVKTLRVRFGSSGTDTMLTVDISTGAASTWVVRGRVIRTGAATQKGWVIGASGNFPIEGSSQALNQTLSGAVTLQITGEATANNDMVIESFVVGWDGNNT